uniref:Inositol hexakisphosphate and diphosphoinositol-pentakisphosphate kinase n=1 Tax=Caenorhabditis tropicalis TaxID=1561998 RepID=A0A1I7U5V0_9PELO
MAPKGKEEQIWPYKITLGICAMHRKATSKPMRAIMKKVIDFYGQWVDFFIFPEQVILNEPIENWPLCHCLISFHSTEFPLEKAIAYVKLRNPYVINDLDRQYDLLDRRTVFKILSDNGIEHPRHGYVIRGRPNEPDTELVEHPDHIEVNGEVFNKPFVEKPISSEDHNVYIYYPSSVGGGSQRLFRKGTMSIKGKNVKSWHINNRSSWYSPKSEVRKEGSYIYEEFIPADGTDVKVYAVGPYYAHAEARKAPGLDGKVERDSDGKEVRYPVILSSKEKQIAKQIVLSFGQTVCGFDLLRANGKSYVCDVNGFSFVKTSTKYYEDTAKILGNQIVRYYAKYKNWKIPKDMPQPPILDLGLGDDPPMITTPSGKLAELRCVVAVIRHGDRTPKQKMKLVVTDQRFFDLFEKYDGYKKNEIKMKKPNQLMEVLELARALVIEKQKDRSLLIARIREETNEEDIRKTEHDLEVCEEDMKRWEQMRTVLEMYGHFSGINRKVQMKYLKERETKTSDEELKRDGAALLLILKWGGELTTAGNMQAEALGRLFRTLYPGIRRTDGKSSPEDTQGLGFLRLHSTYRHDLKIYASDEGRVQTTAAAFAKGLLALEGELTPILMQMVKSANTDGLLDDDCQARLYQTELKRYLHKALQADRDFTPQDFLELNPNGLRSITAAMEFIKNPRKMCHEIAGYVEKMCGVIEEYSQTKPSGSTLYLQESMDLAQRRWNKELREFRRKNKHGEVEFDISKIPDIYDNIKYDMEHNPDLCINNEVEFERMYLCVKNMADIVVPQEYGIKTENKMVIAQRVCTPLLRKIRNDLHRCLENKESEETQTRLDPRASQGIATPFRHVRTRLYFTSESHIHTLMNLIRYGNLCTVDDKKWQRAMNFLSGVTEFNYMTQVVLMVYEDSRKEKEDAAETTPRFHIEILFSPGLYPCFLTEKERIYESRFNLSTNPKPASSTKSSGRESRDTNDSASSSTEGRRPSVEKVVTVVTPTQLSTPPATNDDLSISSNAESTAAESTGLLNTTTKTHNDSEDDLNDVESVNLVALDELNSTTKTLVDDGKAPKRQRSVTGAEKSMEEGDKPHGEWKGNGVAKSGSQISVGSNEMESCNESTETVGAGKGQWVKDLLDQTKRAMAMNSIREVEPPVVEEETSERQSRSRRYFPYRFKHHTAQLLTGMTGGGVHMQNRLISTDVLTGKFGDHDKKNRKDSDFGAGTAVLSTAVIARSSSAPRLMTYESDDFSVGEIKRFWPPLRSLETLHDSINLAQFDGFLERLIKGALTPLPSPPKTPLPSALSCDAINKTPTQDEVEQIIGKLTPTSSID